MLVDKLFNFLVPNLAAFVIFLVQNLYGVRLYSPLTSRIFISVSAN